MAPPTLEHPLVLLERDDGMLFVRLNVPTSAACPRRPTSSTAIRS